MPCFSSFPSLSPQHVNHSLNNPNLKWDTFCQQMGNTDTHGRYRKWRKSLIYYLFIYAHIFFLLFRNVLNNTIFERAIQ